jgi:TolB-like protein/Tfp pilus assembly protein PilF
LKNIEHPVRAFRVSATGESGPGERPAAAARGALRTAARRLARPRALYAGLALLTLVGLAAGGAMLLDSGGNGGPVTIAVLPLTNITRDPADEYFVDGMTEALITSLSRLHGLNVISRTSIMQYKDADQPLPAIARELGATAIVEGSAQLVGDQIRITAQLIDPTTDRHLWAEEYDRPFGDVLRLQSEIARQIAAEIEVTIGPAETQRLDASRPVDPETYRAYLRGMHLLNKGTAESTAEGLRYLHEAVDRDPGDALAQAGLALGYATMGHGPTPQPDAWPRARAAAQRAIALDPELAEAYAALADVKLYMEWDWEGAEQAFRRANELSPSLAMNHYHYAWYLALVGRWDEAIAAHKRSAQLDPLTAMQTAWLGGLYLYQDLGRHQEAIAEAKRALEVQPDDPVALEVLGRAYSAAGEHELAIETGRRMVEVAPPLLWELGMSYARAGQMDEVRAIVADIESRPADSWNAWGLAVLHALLGDLDASFKWLAYEPPHAVLPWVRVDPWVRPLLEDDPRFGELLARLRLPP